MSTIYLLALLGVSAVVLALVVDAVRSVSRRPNWHHVPRPVLAVVDTVDKRHDQLPFVGHDRRRAAEVDEAEGTRRAA